MGFVRLGRIWKSEPTDGTVARALAQRLNLPLPIAVVLAARGIRTPEAAQRFLQPKLSDLSDPEALGGIRDAVKRISAALRRRERIAIFADYDADGLTACALLVRMLRRLGAEEVHPFLPHRIEEGYGLSLSALRRCIETLKPNLILTVDCGTGSAEAVVFAQRQGVDVIVTDHHEPQGEIAPAIAVINPKLQDDPGVRPLAGVGVAFKLSLALCRAHHVPLEEAYRLLDLVATGTVADVVPLVGENRILVAFGLRQWNCDPLPGLSVLAEVAGVEGDIGESHLGFIIGPRLNAPGRLGEAADSLELLLGQDPARLEMLARRMDQRNRERQKIEEQIFTEAVEEISRLELSRHLGLVLARRGWHPGVIGIVASRLVARYGRPVILIALDEAGRGRGSGRSIEGFDLVQHLGACRKHLKRFGGHALAAGLELEEREWPAFRDRFNEEVAAVFSAEDLAPVQKISAWITLAEANDALYVRQEQMRPFGYGNPKPVWAVRRVDLLEPPRVFKGQHVRVNVGQQEFRMPAIGFNLASRVPTRGPVDIAFTLEPNEWMGERYLRMNIQDIRPSAF